MYETDQELAARNATYAPGATISALAGQYGSMRMFSVDGQWHDVPDLPERYTYRYVDGVRVKPCKGWRTKAEALIAEAKRRARTGETIEDIDTEAL